MRSKLLAFAAVALVVMMGFAFRWRYDEISTPVYGKQLLRTCRYTGTTERLTRYGWVSEAASGGQPAAAAPSPLPSSNPYASVVNNP